MIMFLVIQYNILMLFFYDKYLLTCQGVFVNLKAQSNIIKEGVGANFISREAHRKGFHCFW
jgi:hypothetical protein